MKADGVILRCEEMWCPKQHNAQRACPVDEPLDAIAISLFSRYAVFVACVLFTLVTLPLLGSWQWFWVWPFTLVAGSLSLLGCYDLWQKSHAVLRNYPIIGHIRYLIESIRPEIRQYLLEADNEKLPFSRSQRSLVYARAKNEFGDQPFGTLMDVYGSGFEFISNSIRPGSHS